MLTTQKQLKEILSIMKPLFPKKMKYGSSAQQMIVFDHDIVTCATTELHLSIPFCTMEDDEKFGVNIHDLISCVKLLEKGCVELKQDGELLHVIQGALDQQICCQDLEKRPVCPMFTATPQNISQIQAAFGTLYACATDDPRVFLNGVLFEPRTSADTLFHSINYVTTDGHRLALVQEPWVTASQLSRSIIVPKTIMALLQALNSKGYNFDSFAITEDKYKEGNYQDGGYMEVKGDFTLRARLIEGSYPDYHMVIPANSEHTFTIDKSFTKYLQHKNEVTKITFTPGNINLSPANNTVLNFSYNIPNDQIDFEDAVGFNTQYLLDAINGCNYSPITVEYSSNLNPIVFSAGAYKAVIMPARIS